MLKNLALSYAAGSAGGVANSLMVWLCGASGITAAFGVAIAPPLNPAWLYPRVVWGGLWGLLFLVRSLSGTPYLRGMLFSLLPSTVQLLVVFPLVAGKGWLGVELGLATPLFVLFFNAVWGLQAAAVMERVR